MIGEGDLVMNTVDINKIQELSDRYIEISDFLAEEYASEFETDIYSDSVKSIAFEEFDTIILEDKSFQNFISAFQNCSNIEQIKIIQETQLEDSFNVLTKIHLASLLREDTVCIFNFFDYFITYFINRVVFDLDITSCKESLCPFNSLSNNLIKSNGIRNNIADEGNEYIKLFLNEVATDNLFNVLQAYTIYFDNLFSEELVNDLQLKLFIDSYHWYKLLYLINLSIYLDHLYYFDRPNEFSVLKKRKYRDLLDTIAEFSLRLFRTIERDKEFDAFNTEPINIDANVELKSTEHIVELTNVMLPIYFAEISSVRGDFESKYDTVIYNIVAEKVPLINKLTILNSLEILVDKFNHLKMNTSVFKSKEDTYSRQILEYVLYLIETMRKNKNSSKLELALINYILNFTERYDYTIASRLKEEVNNII